MIFLWVKFLANIFTTASATPRSWSVKTPYPAFGAIWKAASSSRKVFAMARLALQFVTRNGSISELSVLKAGPLTRLARMKKHLGSSRSGFVAREFWNCGPASTLVEAITGPDRRSAQQERRAAVRQAFKELWPDGTPLGFMVQQRDVKIIDWFKTRELHPPSGRTISRALKEVAE